MKVKILHLSDLHFQSNNIAQNIVNDSLIRMLKEIVEPNKNFNLLILTGDIAYSGKKEEYEIAKEYIDNIIKVIGITNKEVIIVPGNHDVDRSKIEQHHIDWWYRFKEEKEILSVLNDNRSFPTLMGKKDAFFEFLKQYPNNNIIKHGEIIYEYPCKSKFKLKILGLNSALFCGYDNDDNKKLALGIEQANYCKSKVNCNEEVIISCMHHPFKAFHDCDKTSLNIIQEISDIILSGHLHESHYSNNEEGNLGKTLFISAGACYEKRECENAFNEIEIDLDKLSGTVNFYKYLPKNNSWTLNKEINTKTDGILHFNIEKNNTLIPLRPAKVLRIKLISSEIEIDIDNEIFNIANNFEDFKTFLKDKNRTSFNYRDIVYYIEKFDEESYTYLTGSIRINQILIRQLSKALKNEVIDKKIAEKFNNYNNNVINDESIAVSISSSFVGVIGIQISKLLSIGKLTIKGSEQWTYYIQKSKEIVKLTIDLVFYTLLSKLWDDIQLFGKPNENRNILSNDEKNALKEHLNTWKESLIKDKLKILSMLINVYLKNENKVELPIPELEDINDSLKNGRLYESCINLWNIEEQNPDILDCYHAEKNLTIFLCHFKFLVKYRMVSIKQIRYWLTRKAIPQYLHTYVAIGVGNNSDVNQQNLNYSGDGVFSDVVLLYKGDNYKEGINLFPFIIDYNALGNKDRSLICFYHKKDMNEDSLVYYCLEKEESYHLNRINIAKQREKSEIFSSVEFTKAFNIDCVVDSFQEIQKTLCE
jgi:predicted phosphodiesterase